MVIFEQVIMSEEGDHKLINFLSMPNRFKPREFKEFSGGYSHTRFNHNDV